MRGAEYTAAFKYRADTNYFRNTLHAHTQGTIKRNKGANDPWRFKGQGTTPTTQSDFRRGRWARGEHVVHRQKFQFNIQVQVHTNAARLETVLPYG